MAASQGNFLFEFEMKLLGGNHTVVFAVLGLALAQGAAAQIVQLSVQPGDGKLLISKDIQEQFAEHLGRCIYGGFWAEPGLNVPQQGRIRLDIVEALKKIHVPNLRWPGGCFADTYHWHDGVGPTAQRPKMLNLWWGNTLEDNSFGTHEFLELCQLLGTTPYLAANVGSGTVQEMSNWMEYLNSNEDTPMVLERRKNGHPEPYKVSWWGIGKEVQDYYDKGMRVPDDVTLLLCDDNWDNLRKLPKLADKPRRGGYGIYYHFDYVGGPRNYKWLNTNPLPRIWEQMHLAHEYGANQIWIVNVGDLKPMELPISFFLDYAWNPDAIAANQVAAYTRQWTAQQFGPEHAADIADILARYAKYNARRKPELLDANTYSLATGEWATVVADYNALATRAGAINQKLPAATRDAYFELVLHPVLACANLNELYYTVARNHEAAKTGQSTTNALAEQAKVLYARDAEIKNRYHALAGCKWNHMMDQTHIGYTYRQQPDTDKMPEVLTQPAAAPAATPLPVVTETAYVSLEAEHYTKAVNAGFITWQRLPDLGRTAGAVTAFPVTAAPTTAPGGSSPHLEYRITLAQAGPVTVSAYLAPTLDFTNTTGLRYAVSIDEEAPQLVNLHTGLAPENGNRPWQQTVAESIILKTSQHNVAAAGAHTLKFWRVDPGVVLEKLVVSPGPLPATYLGLPTNTPSSAEAKSTNGSLGQR